MYVCTTHECSSCRSQRGYWIPRNLTYSQLWATMWLLGKEQKQKVLLTPLRHLSMPHTGTFVSNSWTCHQPRTLAHISNHFGHCLLWWSTLVANLTGFWKAMTIGLWHVCDMWFSTLGESRRESLLSMWAAPSRWINGESHLNTSFLLSASILKMPHDQAPYSRHLAFPAMMDCTLNHKLK